MTTFTVEYEWKTHTSLQYIEAHSYEWAWEEAAIRQNECGYDQERDYIGFTVYDEEE